MAYTFPTNYELNFIAPAIQARLSEERVGLQIMPIRNVMAGMIMWQQEDNYNGLQNLRGLEGAPQSVRPIGSNRYAYEPGVYGDFRVINETELVMKAGSVADIDHAPLDLTTDIRKIQTQLKNRELDRVEYMNWTLLTTGTFSVSSLTGVVFTASFALQTISAATAWATVATATPLTDFRTIALLGRGKGVSFGAGAKAYMNRSTANTLLANTNANDIGGKRINPSMNILTIADINRINLDQDNPQIVIYDQGYIDSNNQFQLYIPTGKVVVVGQRPAGQTIGEYIMTRNAVNPGMAPGPYAFIEDHTGNAPDGNRYVPPVIKVHEGHNGGPVIYYPGSVVVLTTT